MGLIVGILFFLILIVLSLRLMSGMAYFDEMEEMIRQKSSKNHHRAES